MIIAVALVLIAGVLAFVFLIRPEDLPPGEAPPPWIHMEERREVIYENLRDLTFEYGLGKLSDEDYAKAKATLQAELTKVNEEIGQLQAAAPQKGKKPVASQPPPGAPAARPAAPVECPHCGVRFDKPMKFCGECGKPMMGGAA